MRELSQVFNQRIALKRRFSSQADAFRQAVNLDPENASYHCLLGDAYVHLGYERQALQHYRNAGKLDPYDLAYVERVRRLTAAGPYNSY